MMEPARGASRTRWSGRLILGSLLAIAAASAMIQPVRSYDLWWHLATGRLILSEGRIPAEDPFSFTRAGTPWLDHEWLFQVLAYQGYATARWPVLLLGTVAIGLGTYLLLGASLLKRTGNGPAIWLLLALSLSGARFRFDFRPETLSYLFLAALCALLQGSRAASRARRTWLLFPLFALWANIHPAALLGGASLILWLTGEWIQHRLARQALPLSFPRLCIALASPLALLLNPGGWHLLAVPLEIRRIVASGHAPNQEWFAPRFSDFPLFYGSVAFALLVLLSPFCISRIAALLPKSRNQDPRRVSEALFHAAGEGGVPLSALGAIDWAPTLVLALMTWLAFQQLRNIGFFFLILPVALARPVTRLLASARVPEWAPRLLGGVVLAVLTPIFLRGAPGWNEGALLSRVAPQGAVDFLERHRVGERLFNDVKFGGYLIWRRYPEHRVFIDGRNEVYEPLLQEIFLALSEWNRWQGMLDRLRIDAAMLRRGQVQAVQYPPLTPGATPRREMRAFSAAYFQQSVWALVYWDDLCLIFVRRGDPAYAGILEREYRVVNPDDTAHLMQEIRAGRVELQAALGEVDRKLGEDPRCETALALRAELAALQARPSH